MNTFTTNKLKNEIDSLFNTITVVVNELNEDIRKILLNIMTTFSTPQLQVAYA